MSLTKCPKCSHRYSSHHSLPLILPLCLHHLCSSCVDTSPTEGVQCSEHQCKQVSWQSKSLISVDFHMLGNIIDSRQSKFMLEQKKLDDSMAQFSLPPHMASGNLACFSISQVTCTSCLVSFCTSCFSFMHRTPVLSTHASVPYNAMDSFMIKTCNKHMKPFEFIGEEDFKLGCSHCVVFEGLKGKRVVDLCRFANEARENGIVKKSLDNANDTLKRLEIARKMLQRQSSFSCESTLKSLELHLARCHRLLEVEGTRLISHVKEMEEEKIKSMAQIGINIGLKMEKIERLMEAVEWAHSDKFDVVLLLEEMEKIEDTDNEFEQLRKLKKPVVIIDQTIISSITGHISISLEDVSVSNRETFVRESKDVVIDSKDSSKTRLSDLLVRLNEEDVCREGDKPVSTHLSGVENVVLRHVLSPEKFFVVRTRDRQMENRLDEMMAKVWNVGERGKVKQGDRAVYKEGEKYSRVKVICVENDLASAIFLDHGNSTYLPKSSMVSLSSPQTILLYTCPPLAHLCTLDGVNSSQLWSDQAARAVEHFFGDQVCKLAVIGRRATTSQSTMMVIITREEEENAVSLLDYLVYEGLATRQKGGASDKLIKSGRLFFPPPTVKQGTEHDVVVQQLDSIQEMQVILMGENNTYAEFLDYMLKEIHVVYTDELVVEQMILMPRVGMVCIAKFSVDCKFYRARVIKVMKDRKVRVEFIDFGSSEVVEAIYLRKIMDKFLELPILAVKVALADVKPVGMIWSEEASQFVREKVRNRVMKMMVMKSKEREKGKKCKVIIYERTQNDSVNNQLVQEGYAIPYVKMVKNEDVVEFNMNHPNLANNFQSLSPQADNLKGTRTPCRVVSAISPDKMNLRRIDQEESFYQLSSSLAKFYNYNSDPGPTYSGNWQVGSYSVVKWQGEGWVRGKVLKFEVDGMIELYMIDYGVRDMLTLELMRPLADQFCMPPYSCTVHLAKLLPAGGGHTWTVAACEKLQGILERTCMVVEIDVVGDMVENSCPVVMYIQEKDYDAGPVDPLVYSYKSVGALLIEDGLAFPPRMETVESVVTMIMLEVIDKVVNTCNADVCEDSVIESPKVLISSFKWIPAVRPDFEEFTCSVSHVDWDCNLFLSTIPDNHDMLKVIGSVLDIKYFSSSPSSEDVQWSPGQSCIAQFSIDKKWYRGEVLTVKDTGKCIVKFVDYGSEELCDPISLRKGLFCTEIPVQCFTVQINDIRPIRDKWEESMLNFVHHTLVDRVLKVTIAHSSDTCSLLVKMVTMNGMDIGEMLVKNGYARKGENIINV